MSDFREINWRRKRMTYGEWIGRRFMLAIIAILAIIIVLLLIFYRRNPDEAVMLWRLLYLL